MTWVGTIVNLEKIWRMRQSSVWGDPITAVTQVTVKVCKYETNTLGSKMQLAQFFFYNTTGPNYNT